MKYTIHITGYPLVGGCIANAGIDPGCIIVVPDLLYWGPLKDLSDTGFWQQERVHYHKQRSSFLPKGLLQGNDFQIIKELINKLEQVEKIWVWLSQDINDQLKLIWLLQVFKYFNIDLSKLFLQLVMVNPIDKQAVNTLVNLPDNVFQQIVAADVAESLTLDAMRKMGVIWSALCSSNPLDLNHIGHQQFYHRKIPHGVIDHYLRQYPDIKSGLSAYEKRVLNACEHSGPCLLDVILSLANSDFDASMLTDWLVAEQVSLFSSVNISNPLLSIKGDIRQLSKCHIGLTKLGRQVLNGQVNNIAINGIDKYIGGVHLSSDKNYLYWRDGDKLVR